MDGTTEEQDFYGLMANVLSGASNAPGIEKYATQIEALMKEMSKGTQYPMWMQIAMPKIVARMQQSKQQNILNQINAIGMGLKFEQMKQKETTLGEVVEPETESVTAPLPEESKDFPLGAMIPRPTGRLVPKMTAPVSYAEGIAKLVGIRNKPKREKPEALKPGMQIPKYDDSGNIIGWTQVPGNIEEAPHYAWRDILDAEGKPTGQQQKIQIFRDRTWADIS